MAAKNNKSSTSSTRNSDGRKNGKAWGKNHGGETKVLTKEQQERKTFKLVERMNRRAARVAARRDPGSPYTMPKITWEWATETVAGRHLQTRRYRMVGMCLAHERGRDYESAETKVEAKSSRKNGR